MDDLSLCPDCLELHAEPLQATLGHLARCPDCALAAELADGPPGPITPAAAELRSAA